MKNLFLVLCLTCLAAAPAFAQSAVAGPQTFARVSVSAEVEIQVSQASFEMVTPWSGAVEVVVVSNDVQIGSPLGGSGHFAMVASTAVAVRRRRDVA